MYIDNPIHGDFFNDLETDWCKYLKKTMPEDYKVGCVYFFPYLFQSDQWSLENYKIKMANDTMVFIACNLKLNFLTEYFIEEKSIVFFFRSTSS